MKASFSVAILLLALPLCSAQVVDRMVAVVNKHVVLQSELEQEVRVDFMLRGLPLAQVTGAEMEAMLERLIDQSLLQQQIVATAMIDATPEELAESLRRLRAGIPGAQDDGRWQSMLAAYGLGGRDVETHVAAQLRLLRFIDLRFRSLTRVDRAAVTAYYQQEFLPERRKQGLPEPLLNEVSGQIEKILVDQRINDLLNNWLATLRNQASVQKLITVSGLSSGAQP
ncbi:MAG: SurA N-terminal domain-containing protein [Acidobacteriia bacterium]|nr:SurA N-terminal domain-containing protein [Terriglobia bacterium]